MSEEEIVAALESILRTIPIEKVWVNPDCGLKTRGNAETVPSLEAMEVSVMNKAIGAYRYVSATDEFKAIERLRSRARHNEASALYHAAEVEREKWQGVVAEKDAENENLRRQLAELQSRLGEGQ